MSSAQAATFNANNGYTPANKLNKNYGKITKQLKINGVSTYLLDDGFGWINEGEVAKIGQSAPSLNTRTHTIRNGDTLSNISAKLGVPMTTLQKNNNIQNANLIYASQVIKY